MRKVLIAACMAVSVAGGIAFAQAPSQDAPPASPAPPPASDSQAPMTRPPASEQSTPAPRAGDNQRQGAKSARAANKNRACRQAARRQGLRGSAMDAQAAVCVAEAMLDCTKQSVSHNFGRRERKAFVRNCMGLPERGNRPQRRKGKDQ